MYPEKRREDRLMNICLHVVKVCITRLILVKILFDYFCITLKQHAISVLKFTRHMHRLRVCVCVCGGDGGGGGRVSCIHLEMIIRQQAETNQRG